MSCKHNSSLADTLILMKLYTVVVYDLRMFIKEDNSGRKNIKGENYLCRTGDILCDSTQTVVKTRHYKTQNNNYNHFHFKSSSNHFVSEIFMTVYKILPSGRFFTCCVI